MTLRYPASNQCDGLAFAIVLLLLALTSATVFGHTHGAFWRFDDGHHLDFVTSYAPWQYFFVPRIVQAQSGIHITPWNAFFYDINLAIFGDQPRLHYAHLAAVIGCAGLMAYALVCRHTGFLGGLTAGLIFLCGLPSFLVGNELMSGHYAYGLLFASASTLLLAAAIVVGLPLYVLAGRSLLNEPNRYLFVPWFLLSLLLGFVVARVPLARWGRVIVAGMVLSSTVVLAQDHRRAGIGDEAAF